jgi:biotin carboxyl carrier protein
MISLDDLDRVLGWMLEQGLQSLSVTEGDAQLTLKLAGAMPSVSVSNVEVKTQAMGVFLPAHPRRPGSALAPGDTVGAGAIVGFLQSGPTLVPVTSDSTGIVTAILAQPGAVLGYGAPVLRLAQKG